MNEEIKNGKPHNSYATSITGSTLNPAPNESGLNTAMNTQHKDSLVNDAKTIGVPHSDSTASTPKGPALVGTEKPVYDGHVMIAPQGVGQVNKKVDYHKG